MMASFSLSATKTSTCVNKMTQCSSKASSSNSCCGTTTATLNNQSSIPSSTTCEVKSSCQTLASPNLPPTIGRADRLKHFINNINGNQSSCKAIHGPSSVPIYWTINKEKSNCNETRDRNQLDVVYEDVDRGYCQSEQNHEVSSVSATDVDNPVDVNDMTNLTIVEIAQQHSQRNLMQQSSSQLGCSSDVDGYVVPLPPTALSSTSSASSSTSCEPPSESTSSSLSSSSDKLSTTSDQVSLMTRNSSTPLSREIGPESRKLLCGVPSDIICHQTSLDDQVFHSNSVCSSPVKSVATSPMGPKFKLIHEGDIHVCKLNHTRTVISKILSSKFLRRWESHRLHLTSSTITSKTPTGFMEVPVNYGLIEDIYVVSRWDSSQKFCIRVVIPDGSLLLQVSNAYLRDQWLHSIQWKRSMLRYKRVLTSLSIRTDVLVKGLRSLIDLTLTTPLQDECIYQTASEIISELLVTSYDEREMRDVGIGNDSSQSRRHVNEDIIAIIAPLLERTNPSNEICTFLCNHCIVHPRSTVVIEYYGEIAQRILKHNMDFGKYPRMRNLVHDYILALNSQNNGVELVKHFVKCIHGHGSTCPHPRVLHNLVSISLAAVFSLFEDRKAYLNSHVEANRLDNWFVEVEWCSKLRCFVEIFDFISNYEDWRPALAQLLQPIPFPDICLAYSGFTSPFKSVISNICKDYRCDVHLMLLGIREEKEGWFHLYCPGNIACDDDGDLWSLMLKSLIGCCCRRKRFLTTLNKCLGPCMLRALREDEACQQALCAMLELDVVENKDMQLQIITTLQSTATGKQHYAGLCQRQLHLKELQQKGGPRKLTLPSRSTDADVAKLLSCGSFGNLECLSLAFTQVTSSCAEQLIKLPSLRYLNLWSTQFGDTGLQLLSEHLHRLQVLNLCETPVTDKGLRSLAAMKNLRKLNLNSTSLSAQTFEQLKQKLPALQECDVRYTDAW